MDDKLKKAKEILKKYNQEHLLQFYNELTDAQRSNLLKQILSIDFEEILYLYENTIQVKEKKFGIIVILPLFNKGSIPNLAI